MDENYYMLLGFCIITNLFWLIMFNISFYKENRLYKENKKLENIIKEVREDLDKQITFCTNEANGTTNDKYCRIAIKYLKHLLEILDEGE